MRFALLILFSFISINAQAEDIYLDVVLGDRLPLNEYVTRKIVADAQFCINQAVTKAGNANLRVLFKPVLREMTADEEALLPAMDYQPALTARGYPLDGMEVSSQTSRFTAYVSNRITRSHVKSYWAREIPLFERMRALEISESHQRCDQYFTAEVGPLLTQLPVSVNNQSRFDQATSNYRNVCNDAMAQESSLLKRELPMGSSLFLSGRNAQTDLANALAREFVRSWGGLTDLPPGVRGEPYKSNLMGDTPGCRLTVQQVQAISEYRQGLRRLR